MCVSYFVSEKFFTLTYHDIWSMGAVSIILSEKFESSLKPLRNSYALKFFFFSQNRSALMISHKMTEHAILPTTTTTKKKKRCTSDPNLKLTEISVTNRLTSTEGSPFHHATFEKKPKYICKMTAKRYTL